MQVIDRLVILRLSLLLTYFISISETFGSILGYFFQPIVFQQWFSLLGALFNFMVSALTFISIPIRLLCSVVSSLLLLSVEVVRPVFTLILELLRLVLSLVKLIFYVPSISIMKILTLFKDAVLGFVMLIKQLKTYVMPLANT